MLVVSIETINPARNEAAARRMVLRERARYGRVSGVTYEAVYNTEFERRQRVKSFLEMFGAAIGWGTLAGALVGSVTFTLAGFVIASSRQALHPDTLLFGAFPTFLLSLVPAAVLSLAFTTLFCVGLWNAMRDTAYAHKRSFSAIGFVVGSAGFMLPDLRARHANFRCREFVYVLGRRPGGGCGGIRF